MASGSKETGGKPNVYVSPNVVNAKTLKSIVLANRYEFERTAYLVRRQADECMKRASIEGAEECDFDVPASVPGRAPYKRSEMGISLAQMLYRDGFSVTGTAHRLHISWRDTSETRKMQQCKTAADLHRIRQRLNRMLPKERR